MIRGVDAVTVSLLLYWLRLLASIRAVCYREHFEERCFVARHFTQNVSARRSRRQPPCVCSCFMLLYATAAFANGDAVTGAIR